jgi:gas vesicle protein
MAEDTSKITYFLAGLGVGTLIGILFAPRSGEETRDYLGQKAVEGREFVARKGREAREQAGEYIEKGKETVARQKSNVQAAFEAGKQAYREATGESSEPAPGKPPGAKPSGSKA